MLKLVKNVVKYIPEKIRKYYHLRKGNKLINKTPSIVTNNCIGGVIYHDLGLEFRSPTINLYFRPDDFLEFVKDLKFFLNCELEETFEDGISFPIGELKRGDDSIKVYFMHYGSFSEAKRKWVERSKRFDYDNVYVILECPNRLLQSSDIWKKFCQLKYKNKLCVTGETDFKDDKIVHLNIYDDQYYPGKILAYKSLFSLHRYLDDVDYVSFLDT